MRKTRKLRGMTLVEIIISMFIFSVIALMMVQIGVVTKSLLMNSNHVNNKTSAESPVAAARKYEALTDSSGEYKTITDNSGNAVSAHQSVTFKITTSNGKTATQTWHKIRAGAAADESGKNCNTNFDGDLEFYVSGEQYEGPTEPTTESPEDSE